MKKLFRWIALSFIALLIAGTALLYGIIGTVPGTRWLIRTGLRVTQPSITIGTIHGTLIHGLTLTDIHGDNQQASWKIDHLFTRWQPLALFVGEIRLPSLHMGAVHITLTEPKSPTRAQQAATSSSSLPIAINIGDFQITRLQIDRHHQSWELHHIHARLLLTQHRFTVNGQVWFQKLRVQAQGYIGLAAPYPLFLSWETTGILRSQWPLQAAGLFKGSFSKLILDSHLTAPYHLTLKGWLSPQSQRADLHLQWQNLHWPLHGSATYASPNGKMHCQGPMQAYTCTLATVLQTASPLRIIRIQARGHGSLDHFTTQQLRIQIGQGLITGRIGANWQKAWSWQTQLQGRQFHDLPGLPILPQPITFALIAHGQGRKITLNRLQVQSGIARLQASGHWFPEQIRIQGHISIPHLHQFIKTTHGQLTGQVSLQGPRLSHLSGKLGLQGHALQYRNIQLDTASLQTTIQSPNHLHASLVIHQLMMDQKRLGQIQVSIQGGLSQQTLQLNWQSTQSKLRLRLHGAYTSKPKQWKGEIETLKVMPVNQATWQLTQPVILLWNPSATKVNDLCLRQNIASAPQLCFSLQQTKTKGLTLSGTWHAFPLSMTNLWLPPTIHLQGHSNGTADLTAFDHQVTGQIKATIPQGSFSLQNLDPPKVLRFTVPELDIQIAPHTSTLAVRANLPQYQSHLQLALQSNHLRAANPPITGTFQATLPNLAVFQPLLPEWPGLAGHFETQGQLSGTLHHPDLSGTAHLQQGQIDIPEMGIHLQHINGQITKVPGIQEPLSLSLQAHSGKGTLSATGTITHWQTPTDIHTHLKIYGHNFQFVNIPMIEAEIDPDMTLQGTLMAMQIHGTLTIPSAKIRIHKLPPQAVATSKDVIIEGRKQPPPSSRKIDLLLKVHLVPNISFSAFGLTGNLGGTLLIKDQNQPLPEAFGNVIITHGRYHNYGLDLPITTGILTFSGPINNPGLNIQMQRQTTAATATLTISGTLNSPQTSITSDPPMPEANALSYLMTGQNLGSASHADIGIMLKAITQLGLENANSNGSPGLLSQIEHQTGFSEIGIQSEGNTWQQSSLVLGRYLTPKLFVRYTTGLFTQLQSLEFNYTLTKHLTLQAITGANRLISALFQINYGH